LRQPDQVHPRRAVEFSDGGDELICRNLLEKGLIEVFGDYCLWIRGRVHGRLEQPGKLISGRGARQRGR
jgi:hypothetical protein